MAMDYKKLQRTADKLIKNFGTQSAVIKRVIKQATGDPWNPIPETEVQEFPCSVVVQDYSEKQIDGTMILQGDKMIIISGSVATTPLITDSIVIAGIERGFINISATQPSAGVVVVYECQCR